MGEIQCKRCGVTNGYTFFKPKNCAFCQGDINGKRLSEKELQGLWKQKGWMK